MNKLKSSIQTLTKSAHPLGKLMDFLQEDVDSMQVGLLSHLKARTLGRLNNEYLLTLIRESWSSGRETTRAFLFN